MASEVSRAGGGRRERAEFPIEKAVGEGLTQGLGLGVNTLRRCLWEKMRGMGGLLLFPDGIRTPACSLHPTPQHSPLAFHLLAALPLHKGLPEQGATQAFSQRAVLRGSPL